MADPVGEEPVAAVGGDAPAEAPGGAPPGEDVELSECPICFDMKPNVKMLVSALCERQHSVATRAARVYDGVCVARGCAWLCVCARQVNVVRTYS